MPLYLIGLGLYEEPCLDINTLELLRKSIDEIYIDVYTSPIPYSLEKLSIKLGKPVYPLRRIDLEDNLYSFIKKAMDKKIALLVYGDPLIATTHRNIILACIENNIEYGIFHNLSSYQYAITESGLDIYKFGGTATVMRGGRDTNSRGINLLKDNLIRGMHTLFLLEYSHEDGYLMHPREAIETIFSDKEIRRKLMDYDGYIIIMSNLGWRDEFKAAYKIDELDKIYNLEIKGPSILIFTGKLHFMEREYIEKVLRGGADQS